VLLIEKAWAKLVGDYLSAERMTADHVMEDLSGAPGSGWWLNTKDPLKTNTEKIKEIIEHSELGHIVVLTSVQDRKIEGIVNNHSLCLKFTNTKDDSFSNWEILGDALNGMDSMESILVFVLLSSKNLLSTLIRMMEYSSFPKTSYLKVSVTVQSVTLNHSIIIHIYNSRVKNLRMSFSSSVWKMKGK
jgi:hypothetical protein